jgi:hypothetical protein
MMVPVLLAEGGGGGTLWVCGGRGGGGGMWTAVMLWLSVIVAGDRFSELMVHMGNEKSLGTFIFTPLKCFFSFFSVSPFWLGLKNIFSQNRK